MTFPWLKLSSLGLVLIISGLALADGSSDQVTISPTRSELKDLHITTTLVESGNPNATIIIGTSGKNDPLAQEIQQVIGHIAGVQIPIATDESEAADIPIRGNLIVIGNRSTNQVVKQLYDRYLCILEADYPGPGGYVVRTIHNPFDTGDNVVLVSGSDHTATAAAVKAFTDTLQQAKREPGALSIGWLMEMKLGQGFDPDKDVAKMDLWESSEWYGPAKSMGWNEVNKRMAMYYLTGKESYAREVLDLLLQSDPTQQHSPVMGDSLTLLLWDLIDESPVFTNGERLLVAEALARGSVVFFDQTYVHTGARKLYRDWDFVTNQPQQEETPLNWDAPLNYRDGTYDFEVEVRSTGKMGISMLIQFGWINAANDPEIRHIASPTIRFDKVGSYRLSGAVSKLPIYYGAGANRDKACTSWDWSKAFKNESVYTVMRRANEDVPENGYPYTLHVRVVLHPAALVRNKEAVPTE